VQPPPLKALHLLQRPEAQPQTILDTLAVSLMAGTVAGARTPQECT
jgi:hypothetical protein